MWGVWANLRYVKREMMVCCCPQRRRFGIGNARECTANPTGSWTLRSGYGLVSKAASVCVCVCVCVLVCVVGCASHPFCAPSRVLTTGQLHCRTSAASYARLQEREPRESDRTTVGIYLYLQHSVHLSQQLCVVTVTHIEPFLLHSIPSLSVAIEET